MPNDESTQLLGRGGAKLRTVDCIAQSLAVGPIFSAAAIGAILASLAGGVGPFVVILTMVGVLGLGYVVSEFAKRYAGAGAVYEYIAHSVGKRAAIMSAAAYYLAYTFLVAALPIIFGSTALTFFQQHFNLSPPWWVLGGVLIVIMAVASLVGIRVSVKTQLIVVILSAIPFLILAVAIIAQGGVHGNTLGVFEPSHMAKGGSIFKGLLFAVLMFVGFELAASLGEETENPRKSIPFAVVATILLVGVFFILTQYIGTIGSGGPGKLAFDFQVLAQHYVGGWLSSLIGLGIMLDIIGIGIGFIAAASRGIFTLARDGLLPKGLARVDRRSVPAAALWTVLGVIIAMLAVAVVVYGASDKVNPSTGGPSGLWLFFIDSTFGSFMIALVYAVLCLGAIKLFIRARNYFGIIAALVGLFVAGGAVASQFISGLAPTGDAVWGRTLALVGIGLIALWLVANVVKNPERVDAAARHALVHANIDPVLSDSAIASVVE